MLQTERPCSEAMGEGQLTLHRTGGSVGASKVGQGERGRRGGWHQGKEVCVGTSEPHCPPDRGREYVPPVTAPVSLSFSWEVLAFLMTGLSEGSVPNRSVFPDPVFALVP